MELRSIDLENVWDIVRLKVAQEQADFVSPNVYSLAEAYAARESGRVALPLGLYEADEPVGFVMIGYGSIGDADEPEWAGDSYCIWRVMIDSRYQGRGLGKAAVQKTLAFIRTWPCGKARYCWLSYDPQNIAAKSLYAQFGFAESGEMDGDEVIAVLSLTDD